MKQKLIVILGPTAVGKTKLAVKLAHKFNGEIISADSRQVYRHMDIGTGKDLEDYKIENEKIPYHLIDVLEPTEEFDLFKFQTLFNEACKKIAKKNHVPFLVGGTGLYIHSILKNYSLIDVNFNSKRRIELESLTVEQLTNIATEMIQNPHNTTDLVEKERILRSILIAEKEIPIAQKQQSKYTALILGVKNDRETIKANITQRLKHRLENGMIEEVENLISKGIDYEKLDFFGLEYKLVGKYIKGDLNYNDMFQKLNSAIHNFAKRQMTWFRKMEREGIEIHWVEIDDLINTYQLVQNFLQK